MRQLPFAADTLDELVKLLHRFAFTLPSWPSHLVWSAYVLQKVDYTTFQNELRPLQQFWLTIKLNYVFCFSFSFVFCNWIIALVLHTLTNYKQTYSHVTRVFLRLARAACEFLLFVNDPRWSHWQTLQNYFTKNNSDKWKICSYRTYELVLLLLQSNNCVVIA